MFVVRVQLVLKVEELKLRILRLFRFNHDLHLTSMFAHKLGRLLDNRVQLVPGGLQSGSMNCLIYIVVSNKRNLKCVDGYLHLV